MPCLEIAMSAEGGPGNGGGSIRYAMETVMFFEAIRDAWCRETSANPTLWNDDLPMHGQCAVTALVVQDALGGDLLRSTICGVSHYWNRLPWAYGYGHLDLTRCQFPADAPLDEPPVERDREYVLSFPETKARYELLRERMGL